MHVDPVDPDPDLDPYPQHWKEEILPVILFRFSMFLHVLRMMFHLEGLSVRCKNKSPRKR
jgi:hypothetical protein